MPEGAARSGVTHSPIGYNFEYRIGKARLGLERHVLGADARARLETSGFSMRDQQQTLTTLPAISVLED